MCLLDRFAKLNVVALAEAQAVWLNWTCGGLTLLGMLVHRQFAVQDPATRAYRPGPRLMEIGLAAVGALDVRARMRPYLSEIAARTGETVSLRVGLADVDPNREPYIRFRDVYGVSL